jgi:hypothetical protein
MQFYFDFFFGLFLLPLFAFHFSLIVGLLSLFFFFSFHVHTNTQTRTFPHTVCLSAPFFLRFLIPPPVALLFCCRRCRPSPSFCFPLSIFAPLPLRLCVSCFLGGGEGAADRLFFRLGMPFVLFLILRCLCHLLRRGGECGCGCRVGCARWCGKQTKKSDKIRNTSFKSSPLFLFVLVLSFFLLFLGC